MLLMIGMLITGSINTISKKAQNDCMYVVHDLKVTTLYFHKNISYLIHVTIFVPLSSL